MKHGDDEGFGNGREKLAERDASVSDLVVRVNEPDIYTPTLDLADDPAMAAQQDLLRQAATKPGLRRVLRTNVNHQLELVPTDEKKALEELQHEVEKYRGRERSWMPWILLGATVVSMIIAFWASRK